MVYIMDTINNYFRKNKIITNDIYNKYLEFNFQDENEFITLIDYLINVYNIDLVEMKQLRKEQYKFRTKIIGRDRCCIVSKFDVSECEAAHIVPLNIDNNFDPNNGILLNSNLHKLYDDGYWCINPDTLQVELNMKKINNKNLSCNLYNGVKVNIQPNDDMMFYLYERYTMFKR